MPIKESMMLERNIINMLHRRWRCFREQQQPALIISEVLDIQVMVELIQHLEEEHKIIKAQRIINQTVDLNRHMLI